MNGFTIDHLAYITKRHHRRQVHAAIRRLPDGRISDVNVLHEGDDICCRLEPWPVTARRISVALGQDGEPNVWAFVETRP